MSSKDSGIDEEAGIGMGKMNMNDLERCSSLYRAAVKGDWEAAELAEAPTMLCAKITPGGERVLHIAVAAKQHRFVEHLVALMARSDLTLTNNDGKTAFFLAATSGAVEIAKVMAERNADLPLIADGRGLTPLSMAAANGQRDMLSYLFSLVPFESLPEELRFRLFLDIIDNEMYDIALSMLEKDRHLACRQDWNLGSVLQVLVKKPLPIAKGNRLGFAERFYSWLGLRQSRKQGFMCEPSHHLSLVKKLCKEVEKLQDRAQSVHLYAARVGNVDLVKELLLAKPDLMWERDGDGRNIWHIAALYRQQHIFSILREVPMADELMLHFDNDGNNILHLAANLAPEGQLDNAYGPALQMHQELIWYKDVEKMVPPSYRDMKNGTYGLVQSTPREVFSSQHKSLMETGEKWMKKTATSFMLVATLVATVVFAAAFTVPGGNNNDTGVPMLVRKKWFLTFAISDAIALFLSTVAIIKFLSVITSRYSEQDFLETVFSKMMNGVSSLFLSIASMAVTFSAAYVLIFENEIPWVPVLIGCFACSLVITFMDVTLFWPLFYAYTEKYESFRRLLPSK